MTTKNKFKWKNTLYSTTVCATWYASIFDSVCSVPQDGSVKLGRSVESRTLPPSEELKFLC